MVKALTRGGDPKAYKIEQIHEQFRPLIETLDSQFSIRVDDLPIEIPYINFDIPNDISNGINASLSARSQNTPAFLNRGKKEEKRFSEITGLNSREWFDQFPTLSYKINNYGMRNEMSFDDLGDNEYIPAFGDSNTFGIGMPAEELWHNKLKEDLPIYNAGVHSGNLTDVYLMMQSMYDSKKFKKAYVCIPHAERWTGVSDAGYFEGITNGAHYYLEQFKHAPEVLNINTRQMYRWLAIQNIINFCAVNDIELRMYESNTFMHVGWCGEQNLHIPNWYFIFQHMHKNIKIVNDSKDDPTTFYKHTARDLIHFGSEWHDKMAQHLINI